MMQDEQIYTLALTHIPGLGLIGACNLVRTLGSASAIFQHRKELKELIPEVSDKLIKALDCPKAFQRAELELEFTKKNQIQCLTLNAPSYPSRLKECEDAPLALFYRGNSPLNTQRVISIVGTRHATKYGEDLCTSFMQDLANLCPNTLIVSGLAYGIDIHAHRNALEQGFPTIGVLAHGLDRIYPSAHRKTAIEMMDHGGLLTEFMSGTNPDRQNFVRRNRIVAGMSDATIVVESAAKGGALITAELAESYHRDCFAFPGRATDIYSAGCNELIKSNRASLILSAEDFVHAMSWNTTNRKPKEAIQQELFLNLNEEEQKIVDILQESIEGIQINTLVVKANIPIHRLSALLFELEMKGVVKSLAGSVYKLT